MPRRGGIHGTGSGLRPGLCPSDKALPAVGLRLRLGSRKGICISRLCRIHPAPLARPFSKGLHALGFATLSGTLSFETIHKQVPPWRRGCPKGRGWMPRRGGTCRTGSGLRTRLCLTARLWLVPGLRLRLGSRKELYNLRRSMNCAPHLPLGRSPFPLSHLSHLRRSRTIPLSRHRAHSISIVVLQGAELLWHQTE